MELIVKGLDTKRLTVDCNATVGELKKMISQEFINLDSRRLSSYGLRSMSTVMVLSMRLYELQSKIYNNERIPVDEQKLIYNGMQLEGSKKLQDYITPGSTIDMTLCRRA